MYHVQQLLGNVDPMAFPVPSLLGDTPVEAALCGEGYPRGALSQGKSLVLAVECVSRGGYLCHNFSIQAGHKDFVPTLLVGFHERLDIGLDRRCPVRWQLYTRSTAHCGLPA